MPLPAQLVLQSFFRFTPRRGRTREILRTFPLLTKLHRSVRVALIWNQDRRRLLAGRFDPHFEAVVRLAIGDPASWHLARLAGRQPEGFEHLISCVADDKGGYGSGVLSLLPELAEVLASRCLVMSV